MNYLKVQFREISMILSYIITYYHLAFVRDNEKLFTTLCCNYSVRMIYIEVLLLLGRIFVWLKEIFRVR